MITDQPIHVISLGAGVQSTTVLLMALEGLIQPRPVAAIFADTGWEPAAVYDHLAHLTAIMDQAGLPLYRVSHGNLRDDALAYVENGSVSGWRVPYHVRNTQGESAMLQRQCTRDYKIRPIHRQIKRLIRQHSAQGAISWVGISLDEATRMKPASTPGVTNRWPLIERRMTRADCLRWLEERGHTRPPRSSCIGCPFHTNAEWRRIRDVPADWADAVDFDTRIRNFQANLNRRKPIGEDYLHRSLVPLPMVDLSTPQERGQMELDLWPVECEGMCGV